MSVLQITLGSTLSTVTNDPIGSYEKDFLRSRPAAVAAVGKFKSDLAALSWKIKERNRQLPPGPCKPYTYLDPDQVAQGIAI